ncbi:MAG: hypothetical protein OXC62_15515 [Aestuariivita sp.]|nr:hypothetical protein [Aestuariivita sp.]
MTSDDKMSSVIVRHGRLTASSGFPTATFSADAPNIIKAPMKIPNERKPLEDQIDVVQTLINNNPKAHFVRLNGKKAFEKEWQKTSAPIETVLQDTRDGKKVGVFPSTLGLFCVDIDDGDYKSVIEAIGAPLTIIKTGRGAHLYYRPAADLDITVKPYVLRDDKNRILARGEVRHHAVCAMWEPWKLAMIPRADNTTDPIDPTPLFAIPHNVVPITPARTFPTDQTAPSIPDLWQMIRYCPSLDDYDSWYKAGMSLYAATGGLPIGHFFTRQVAFSAHSSHPDESTAPAFEPPYSTENTRSTPLDDQVGLHSCG